MSEADSDARLLRVFGLVNEWLKYAEVKNGVLVSFNGGLIFGLNQLAVARGVKDGPLALAPMIMTFFLTASLVVGLASFYGRTRTPQVEIASTPLNGDANAAFLDIWQT